MGAHRSTIVAELLMVAVALPAERAAAYDLGAPEQPVTYGETLSRPEIDARYGWLTLTGIEDARQALHTRRLDQAHAIIGVAQSALLGLQQPDDAPVRSSVDRADRMLRAQAVGSSGSSIRTRLAEAQVGLCNGQLDIAADSLRDAEAPLHDALVRLDALLHPQSVGISVVPGGTRAGPR